LGRLLLQAAEQDWSQVDPSIFGTLFERVIDEGKRAQLGAHYTSEEDIMLIVEPVLMAPLKRRWNEVRRQASALLTANADPAARQQASEMLQAFAAEIANLRLLDPSCGSGNFLYVGLRELLSLQKEVITFAARRELPPIALSVGPEQLYGIEINAYAHELAQITVWIGYLQWRHENGFARWTTRYYGRCKTSNAWTPSWPRRKRPPSNPNGPPLKSSLAIPIMALATS
jgi:type II restriction/modification system DNA methylase subunit YeeA